MSLVQYRRRVERGDAVGPLAAPPQTPLERALAELAEERSAHDLARTMLAEAGREAVVLRARVAELEALLESATQPKPSKRAS